MVFDLNNKSCEILLTHPLYCDDLKQAISIKTGVPFDAFYIEVAKVEFLETKCNELVTTYIDSVDANCQTDIPRSVDAFVQYHQIASSMCCSKVAETFPFDDDDPVAEDVNTSDQTKDCNGTDDTTATPLQTMRQRFISGMERQKKFDAEKGLAEREKLVADCAEVEALCATTLEQAIRAATEP